MRNKYFSANNQNCFETKCTRIIASVEISFASEKKFPQSGKIFPKSILRICSRPIVAKTARGWGFFQSFCKNIFHS